MAPGPPRSRHGRSPSAGRRAGSPRRRRRGRARAETLFARTRRPPRDREASLSRRLHRHYRGFATGQLREWEKDGLRSTKKLLYVLRTPLTGTHALLTREIETDVTLLLDAHGFGAARELVEAKRRGERSELPSDVAERWKAAVDRAFDLLDSALERSPLPDEPPNVPEVEAWLVDHRLAHLPRRA